MDKIFGKPFQPKKIIDNPSDESLREWALQHGGIITEFGNLSVITKVRNRIAKLTEVIMDEPDSEDLDLVHKVLEDSLSSGSTLPEPVRDLLDSGGTSGNHCAVGLDLGGSYSEGAFHDLIGAHVWCCDKGLEVLQGHFMFNGVEHL